MLLLKLKRKMSIYKENITEQTRSFLQEKEFILKS